MEKLIFAGEIYFPDRIATDMYVHIVDNRIDGFYNEKTAPKVSNVLDFSQYIVAPGYVDTHIHGYAGYDVMDCDDLGLERMSLSLLSRGVTSFLATTITSSNDQLLHACEHLAYGSTIVSGAKIQGIFLEGPFFSEEHKGAQNPSYFKIPDTQMLDLLQRNSNGMIRKVAVAPELSGSYDFIRHATSRGIKIALGHSGACYETATRAVEYGATIFVHTFNGMSGLHHREPGMAGAALSLREIYAELIADGNHVNPVVADILIKMKGVDHTILVSDCMRAGGMVEGNYMLGDYNVFVKDGIAKLENGSLAGSVLSLDNAVKNIVKWGLATPWEAVQMATLTSAKSVGLEVTCGQLKIGGCADFIVLDKQLEVVHTFIDGERVYSVTN